MNELLTLPPISSTPPATIVLDTNVVLDWLLFSDPQTHKLADALLRRELCWIATQPMREELDHVLQRGTLARWQPDLPALWLAWDQHCTAVDIPPPRAASPPLRCTDPDDQKFIDLATTSGARWLLSRDRAVLKLARRLRDVGVETLTPADWSQRHGR